MKAVCKVVNIKCKVMKKHWEVVRSSGKQWEVVNSSEQKFTRNELMNFLTCFDGNEVGSEMCFLSLEFRPAAIAESMYSVDK